MVKRTKTMVAAGTLALALAFDRCQPRADQPRTGCEAPRPAHG